LSLLRVLWAALLLPFLTVSASSQQVEDYASVTPIPDWVAPAPLDLSPFEMDGSEREQWLLLDWQLHYRDGRRVLYHHRATRPNTIEATSRHAAVQIPFDPAYAKVELHMLKVHRDGEVRDLLDLSEMDIYRFETDRDRLIYNGELELSHLLPDIRVGDVIEYAFSRVGSNPALDPHFGGFAQHQFTTPVRFLRNRFVLPAEANLVIRRAGFVDQTITTTDFDDQGDRLAHAILAVGREVTLSDLTRLVRALRGRDRLSTTFRFEAGTRLNVQSADNILRLAKALELGAFDGQSLLFAGFSDAEGPAGPNKELALKRAQLILDQVKEAAPAADFSRVQMSADSFGEALPIACDDTSWGRAINRRVEVWVE
jgi:outer membrane protein OmpA-like peptidoglycan-associated protein